MNMKDFTHRHYESQSKNEAEYNVPAIILKPDCVDEWLHMQKYNNLMPIISHFPDATWLTVGDGRFGSDAFFLNKNGISATASSISDATLKIAAKRGYISDYRVENAEDMQSKDDEFDFVLCKESYHHFPRPGIAFYEMLRVASQALILIKPIEGGFYLLDWLKGTAIKRLIRGDKTALFESSGNFIYRTSIREIEKMATAINGPLEAFKPFNFFFHPKLAGQKYGINFGTILTRAAIWFQDILCALGLMNYGLAAMVVFKQEVHANLRAQLTEHGYRLIDIPQNPYFSR